LRAYDVRVPPVIASREVELCWPIVLIREREKQRLRGLTDRPSFPRLCEARGESWRIVPHTRELDSIMARLEQLGVVKS
jgi:hypothetical protein